MSSEISRSCPDCKETMVPIVVMDKTIPGLVPAGTLEYRLPDDKHSIWSGRFPTAGAVSASMCGRCGRISLYGAAQPPK